MMTDNISDERAPEASGNIKKDEEAAGEMEASMSESGTGDKVNEESAPPNGEDRDSEVTPVDESAGEDTGEGREPEAEPETGAEPEAGAEMEDEAELEAEPEPEGGDAGGDEPVETVGDKPRDDESQVEKTEEVADLKEEDHASASATEAAESTGGETDAVEGSGAEDEEKAGRMRWYVVHTYSGREKKVRDTIERLISSSGMEAHFGKVLMATEQVAEMKKGKKKVSSRKLFPSYILIEMEMTDKTWSLIENAPGVTHFVGGGKKPFPIPKKEVDRILGRMEKKEGVIPEVPFTLGEHVNVIDGPFADFTGVVDEINPERGKLKVLVSIFGRETPVELDFLQVKSL